MEELRRVTASLDRPIKRVGFVVLAIGVVVTLIGFIQIGSDLGNYRWFEKFLSGISDALFFERYTYRRYPLACLGPYIFVAGLLCSFLYDRTVGRFLAWIRNG